jgi:CheY-like chemotaxis protein
LIWATSHVYRCDTSRKHPRSNSNAQQHPILETGIQMRDVSIFLVEDETLIRMMIAAMIAELGHTVVAEAGNIADALALAKTADFEMAILDINLGGQRIDPVAEIIDGRRLPFIFASGYGAAGLPEKFRDRTVLRKPFLITRLAKAIETTFG